MAFIICSTTRHHLSRKPLPQDSTSPTDLKMTATALLCIATPALALGEGQTQLDCNSQLRLLYPELFKHCNCKYSDWSDWEPVPGSAVSIPTWQCSSGEAYTERRTQEAIEEGCDPRTESRRICKCKGRMLVACD